MGDGHVVGKIRYHLDRLQPGERYPAQPGHTQPEDQSSHGQLRPEDFQTSDPDVGSFRLDWRWNNEDSAGNPIHLALILLTGIAVVLFYATGRFKDRDVLWYSLAAILSSLLFVLSAHYDDYGVRFQLPLILIWAPVFGTSISRFSEKWLAPLAIFFLLVISLPYVLFNSTRPLIGATNDPEPYAIHPLPGMGTTKSSSIFHADPQTLLFVNAPDLSQPYMEITNDIRNSGWAGGVAIAARPGIHFLVVVESPSERDWWNRFIIRASWSATLTPVSNPAQSSAPFAVGEHA